MNINIRQNLKNHAKIWQMIIIINSNEKMRKGVNPREKFLNSNVASCDVDDVELPCA